MKRFWKDVAVTPVGDGFGITLDGKPVRTPARAALKVGSIALAEAIAEEWRGQDGELDPRSMPLTGLANAATDRADPALADSVARFGESDLLYYRADSPAKLAERQADRWDPLLQWARQRFDVDFITVAGITYVAQPEATVRRLAHAVGVLDPFRLAGLSQLVTIGGSLIAGLAVIEGARTVEQAWDAVSIDEAWQLEQWGADREAEIAMAARRRDFLAAARFVELLDG
jgi:chaperone required for assembly of F1-ATPase